MIQFLQNGIAPIFVRDFSQRQQQSRAVGTERGTIVNLHLILAEKVAFFYQKLLIHLLFPQTLQTYEPFIFTELENLSKVNTLPTAEILSGKNARAWVSMVLYLKKNEN